jgi:beta-xylosidase
MIAIRNCHVITVVVLAITGAGCALDDPPGALDAAGDAVSGAPGARTGQRARVFTNPVLPGDHPDMNLFVQGNDFYVTGSAFNMAPNVEILHSTDLVHWERVSRVVDPEWPGLQNSIAGGGTWGGFIVKIAAGYRIYFAVNFNQFFAEAPSLAGPWTDPTQLNAFPYTPPGAQISFNRGNGYDDSVFVDDDGKTYLVIKAGQCKWNGLSGGNENNFGINLITELDPATGMLIPGTTRDLSFVNENVANGGCGDPAGDPAHADTSHWAEGPSMIKRNGFYYYFVTTHTGCGGAEFVWRSLRLSGDPADWTPLGALTMNQPPFDGAQHSTAPIRLADGTWWALFHSYECTGGWNGLARQGLLGQIVWTDDGVPQVGGDWTAPAPAPALPSGGNQLLAPFTDDFDGASLATGWTFYDHPRAAQYSLADRPGWLRVKPDPGRSLFVVQKDALHASAMITELSFTPGTAGAAAGLRVGNAVPAEDVGRFDPVFAPRSIELSLARVWDGGDVIRLAVGSFAFGSPPVLTVSAVAPAPATGRVWLKLVRADHQATGWYSTDRITWHQVGGPVDIAELDAYDSLVDGWVGNQAGVFATGQSADFGSFAFRDGFTRLPASEPDQRSAGAPVASATQGTVLGGLHDRDWVMYSGIDLGSDRGRDRLAARTLELTVATAGGRRAERRVDIWLDRLEGPRIATCELPSTGGLDSWQTVRCPLRAAGTHDVYLQVKGGAGEIARIASLRFSPRHHH